MNRYLLFVILYLFILKADCQTVDFTFTSSNNLFCSPSTINFTQTCTGNPQSFIWDFGNNTYGDQPVQSTVYATPGAYTVKLIAIFQYTTLSISKVVVINPAPVASITADRNYLCQPGPINFTGSGNGTVTNYEWNFADGTPVMDVATNTITHSFASLATNNVSLTITDGSGCTGVAYDTVVIGKLPITGTESRFRGCIPASVDFTGNVTLPAGSTVTNYTWDYGDGSPLFTSPTNTVTHNYPLVGIYYPKLSVTTSEGCANTYNFDVVYFGTPPTGATAYPKKDTVCGSDSAVLICTAVNANRYYWDFGDGSFLSTTDTIVKHKYNSIGVKTIGVTSYFNECAAPFVRTKVTIVGVIAKYAFANTCINKDTYSFTDTSSGTPTGFSWNFGDGSPIDSLNFNTVHVFPPSGQFTTTLKLTDAVSGCADSIMQTIFTAKPSLNSIDTSICKNDSATFSILNNYTNSAAQYTWNVEGTQVGPVPDTVISVKATQLGNFNNFVIINNGAGNCPDTVLLSRQSLVRGPYLSFNSLTYFCLNQQIVINDSATHPFVPADSINLIYWNFSTGINDTVFQPPPFFYANPGTYNLKVVAQDINGCRDSIVKTIYVVAIPFLHVLSAVDTLCYGMSDTLIAFHNNNILWSPAAGLSCTACDTTLASPLVSTKYYVTAENGFNCVVQDSTYINVSLPFTAAITPASASICQQQSTTVDVSPKGKVVLWSPAAGLSDPTSYTPVISPTQNTVYTATLSDSAGCVTNSSSATVSINVKSLPTVDAGPDAFYPKGASYTFAPVYSSNVSSYLWSPSDLLSCNTCPIPQGYADRTQTYILQVTSDSGCVATDSVTISIECKYANLFMPKAFTPNNDNLNDVFYPITIGVKSITKFIIFDRRGEVMYEAENFSPNDRSFGWDGKFKGTAQPMGGYVYILEAVCDIGEKLFKKDSFILVR